MDGGWIFLPRSSDHCDIAQTVFPMSRQTAQYEVASRVTNLTNARTQKTNDRDRHHYCNNTCIPQNYNKAPENRPGPNRKVVSEPPIFRESDIINGYSLVLGCKIGEDISQ